MSLRSDFRVVMSVVISFRIKVMFASSLPPVVCRGAHMLFILFEFVAYNGVLCALTVYIHE